MIDPERLSLAAVTARRRVLLVAQVLGHLDLEPTLDHPSGSRRPTRRPGPPRSPPCAKASSTVGGGANVAQQYSRPGCTTSSRSTYPRAPRWRVRFFENHIDPGRVRLERTAITCREGLDNHLTQVELTRPAHERGEQARAEREHPRTPILLRRSIALVKCRLSAPGCGQGSLADVVLARWTARRRARPSTWRVRERCACPCRSTAPTRAPSPASAQPSSTVPSPTMPPATMRSSPANRHGPSSPSRADVIQEPGACRPRRRRPPHRGPMPDRPPRHTARRLRGAGYRWATLAHPEGNEFDVIAARLST
jgi:hypothetical protein